MNLAKCYLAEATAREVSQSSEAGAGMEKRSQQDPIAIELRQSALAELKRAALHFKRIEDIQRLRQVYYLQARLFHLLPNSKKKRDKAAEMFMQLSSQMHERVRNPGMATSDTNTTQQHQVKGGLNGVIIKDFLGLQRCLAMKLRR